MFEKVVEFIFQKTLSGNVFVSYEDWGIDVIDTMDVVLKKHYKTIQKMHLSLLSDSELMVF